VNRADLLVIHASELVVGSATPLRGAELNHLSVIVDGAFAVRHGRVVATGTTAEITAAWTSGYVIDAAQRLVTPSFVDAHAHLVHAGSRHGEWESRATGIPKHGIDGGIRWSIEQTRKADSDTMQHDALALLDVALEHGTTVFETKTGYGLDVETELRLLRVAASLDHPVQVISTYLGGHVVPPEYVDRRDEYVQLVVDLMPEAKQWCNWFDVWCDPIGFTRDESLVMIEAARAAGMKLRVHADQTGSAGGVGLAVAQGARSVDHLEHISDTDLEALSASDTVGIVLPAVTFHMLEGSAHVADWCRKLIESQSIIALATDFNPGTCPTISMQMVMQCAARLYRMSYAEIWNAVTVNSAASLDIAGEVGCLQSGARADFIVWNAQEHGQIINRFGTNQVDQVFVRGHQFVADGRRLD
jgi:imidazolonepropionase